MCCSREAVLKQTDFSVSINPYSASDEYSEAFAFIKITMSDISVYNMRYVSDTCTFKMFAASNMGKT